MDDFADVIAFGAEQSQLAERLAAAAGELGLAVAPDPVSAGGYLHPLRPIFPSSRAGVPSLFLFMGFTDTRGAQRRPERCGTSVIASIAHTPSDDLAQPIDYQVAAKFADVFRR